MSDEIARAEITEVEANRLTQRIELNLESAANAWESAIELIREAYDKNAYLVLGYRSHGDYMREKFSTALSRLSVEERREGVQELSAMGLSVRAIAPIVGASKSQVARDISGTVPGGTPSQEIEQSAELAASVVANTVPVTPTMRTVTGIDGRTQEVPAKKEPRRRPITDTARELGWEIRKRADRLERLMDDDRFTFKNRDDLRDCLRSDIEHMITVGEMALEMLGDYPTNGATK